MQALKACGMALSNSLVAPDPKHREAKWKLKGNPRRFLEGIQGNSNGGATKGSKRKTKGNPIRASAGLACGGRGLEPAGGEVTRRIV